MMNKTWMQPPFDRYIASLNGALASIEATIGSGTSTPDRALNHAVAIMRWTVKASGQAGVDYKPGGIIWLCGNGGSGSAADHIACDMALKGWRAFSLTNPALTTTMVNDRGADNAFSAQLDALSRPGDVVIGMSCSGESENVVRALSDPRHVHVSLTGFKADNRMRKLTTDASFYVPSMKYAEVQIAHLAVLHAMIDLAEGVP